MNGFAICDLRFTRQWNIASGFLAGVCSRNRLRFSFAPSKKRHSAKTTSAAMPKAR